MRHGEFEACPWRFSIELESSPTTAPENIDVDQIGDPSCWDDEKRSLALGVELVLQPGETFDMGAISSAALW